MKKELILLISYLTCIATLTSIDIVIDLKSGSGWRHIFIEASLVVFLCVGIIFSITRLIVELRTKISRSAIAIERLQQESEKWRKEAASALERLSLHIDEQFNRWNFTKSEKEIASLLLKGISLKDISAVRKVQEKTIRQQASSLYQKAGLGGRVELSAFFLEGLLDPVNIK